VTLIAPTDKAFAKIPKEKLEALLKDTDKLKKILAAHVVEGKKLSAAELKRLEGEKLNGFVVDVKDGIKIGEAKVIKADIPASNGVIHVVDAVMLPKE
jgi:uncharacterized surface protein with fasciclin (FAS1) repeats